MTAAASKLPDHSLLTECPLCSGTGQDLWRQKNGYDVVRCTSCTFIYARDLPSVDVLRKHYEPSYQGGEDGFQPAGGPLRPLKYHAFRLWIRRFFPRDQIIRTLEVGCGQGDFLRSVKNDKKFEARGLDYAEAPLKYASSLGLRVDQGDIQSLGLEDESFDLAIALHVLEHVQDPNGTIAEIFRVLRPGGYAFAVTPSVTHFKANRAGESWKYLGLPGHLWYYSPKTLPAFFEKAGFEKVMASHLYHRAHVRVLVKKPQNSGEGGGPE